MKSLYTWIAATFLFLYGVLANATSQYDALTTAVSFADVITAILAVAAVMAGVLVVRKGVKLVLGSIK